MRLSEMVFINTDFERLFIERTLLVNLFQSNFPDQAGKRRVLARFVSSIKNLRSIERRSFIVTSK